MRRRISAMLVLALGLMVWSTPMADGAQSLTVNGQALDSIILEVGQSCTVEVVSDDSGTYEAFVGFDNGVVLGSFLYYLKTPLAGDSATVTEYNEPAFYGYDVVAAGGIVFPVRPGIHFVFEYEAQEVGETDLKLYQNDPPPSAGPLLDSVLIMVTTPPEPMGTAITYQGRLMDANGPADGFHDFRFRLYNSPDPVYATQQGGTVDINDVDVIEGYFTVELDFGSDVFEGDALWLETAVSPGDSNEVNDFVTLSPRTELTPTPYALHTRGVFVGDENTFVGLDAGRANTTGNYNTFSGYQAGYSNTTGYYNTFSGQDAGYLNTTGYSNTFSGQDAGYSNTVGMYNTFVGQKAGYSNTTSFANTFVGQDAGYSNTTSIYNTFVGRAAGYSNTTGERNTFLGLDAGYSNTTGERNTFLGQAAGRANTEGNYNTFLGTYAGLYNQTGTRNVFIGYQAGYNETGSNKLYIANSDADPPLIYGDFSTGNVGIGTTNPWAGLHLKGTGYPSSFMYLQSDANEDTGFRLHEGADVKWHLFNDSDLGGLSLRNNAYSSVLFAEQSTGNVGIGTLTPNSALEVAGTIHTTSGGFKFPDGTTQTTAATGGGLLQTTVLNVNCANLSSVSTSYAKILDVGSFTKINPGSTIEITFNGRIGIESLTDKGAIYELRVDDAATTNGRARARLVSSEVGLGGIPASITGIFTGLSSGSHTVSIWVQTSSGTGSNARVDPGCWSSDHIVIKELL